jgi:hypothetical protein
MFSKLFEKGRRPQMPTRSNKTSKSSASQTTAKGKTKKGTNPKPTAGADPPIIVQGGGSIGMNVPPKFTANGSGPNGQQFRHGAGNIVNVEITNPAASTTGPSGAITVTLNLNSRVKINYT